MLKPRYAACLPIALFIAACGTGDNPSNATAATADAELIDGDLDIDATEGADALDITPVSHASFVLTSGETVIYNDPVGGPEAYADFTEPDIVLVSDIHGDHLDSATLVGVVAEDTELIVPQAVADQLPPQLAGQARVLANGAQVTTGGVKIYALPMYNLREEALEFHPRGRGNGYLLTVGGERVYIAGDTEDVPEMRGLEDIDVAFVPMNLPYTMPVEAAASAVAEFAPAVVYPYHYRGQEGFSDTARFRQLVAEAAPDVQVIGLEWYPERDGE